MPLDDCASVPSWEVEMARMASTPPLLPSNDCLCLVIDIVDGGEAGLSFFMSESMIDWDISHSEAVDQLVIVWKILRKFVKGVICLPDSCFVISHHSIDDVVIVEYSFFVSGLQFTFVRSCTNQVLIWLRLPNTWDAYLWVVGFV